MSLRNTIRFTQIPDTLAYPPALRATLSTVHSNLINQVSKEYHGTTGQRRSIVKAINTISYMYISGDSLPVGWDISHPMEHLIDIDDDVLRSHLGDLYVSEHRVDFDIDIISTDNVIPVEIKKPVVSNDSIVLTPKSDLYIQPPTVPQFDIKSPYVSKYIDGDVYTIYSSYPKIPRRQNEISVTTDIGSMADIEFLNLYPNHMIRTRANSMYESYGNIPMDPVLGLILPISGFTYEQIRDNIIKYPHLFKLYKQVDDDIQSFYITIELDGELYPISDVWNKLPESKLIPFSIDFVKEFVVRKYLLERDFLHIDHRYSIYGTLDPYLTLFTTPDEYASMGYTDTLGMAKSCVASRISYKRSRNPMLRKLGDSIG